MLSAGKHFCSAERTKNPDASRTESAQLHVVSGVSSCYAVKDARLSDTPRFQNTHDYIKYLVENEN